MNIVILGAGIVGTHIAEILSGRGHDVILADRDVKSIARLENRIDLRCVVGDVVSFKTLSQAGVANADLLLSVTDNDAINIVAGQMSRRLGARKVISRIRLGGGDPVEHRPRRGPGGCRGELRVHQRLRQDDALACA